MNESPLNELDAVLRQAVEHSRQTPIPDVQLMAALERIAARTPAPAHRSSRQAALRGMVAAAAVLLAAALLLDRAPPAWAEVAAASRPASEIRIDADPPSAQGPPERKLRGLLLVHIGCVLAGYAAYALAWLLSCTALLAMLFADASRLLRITERISAVLVALGMQLMAVGVVLGAIWAEANLGRYWGWDIKEINGLATLLIGVAWLGLTWRQMRSAAPGASRRFGPGALSAACFWASMAGCWFIAFVGGGILLWQTGVFICICVLLNVLLVAGAAWAQSGRTRGQPG